MNEKKYSPIVLSKATTLALHLAEQSLRALLRENMDRMIHLTLDDSRFDRLGLHSLISIFKSEILASVKCKGKWEKILEVEITIGLSKGSNGEWRVGSDGVVLRFPNCASVRSVSIHPHYWEYGDYFPRSWTFYTDERKTLDYTVETFTEKLLTA